MCNTQWTAEPQAAPAKQASAKQGSGKQGSGNSKVLARAFEVVLGHGGNACQHGADSSATKGQRSRCNVCATVGGIVNAAVRSVVRLSCTHVHGARSSLVHARTRIVGSRA